MYYCGWHAKESYGAASYLIVRPRGNVLVDSPRAAAPLYERIEALGGVRTMVLSHRDDVADQAAFARRFGCERVMHADDAGTLAIEHRVTGRDPIVFDEELTIVPVPGHTRGSIALLYRDKFLFTGDHLWWDEVDERLDMGRDVCWYSWSEQVHSLNGSAGFASSGYCPATVGAFGRGRRRQCVLRSRKQSYGCRGGAGRSRCAGAPRVLRARVGEPARGAAPRVEVLHAF